MDSCQSSRWPHFAPVDPGTLRHLLFNSIENACNVSVLSSRWQPQHGVKINQFCHVHSLKFDKLDQGR